MKTIVIHTLLLAMLALSAACSSSNSADGSDSTPIDFEFTEVSGKTEYVNYNLPVRVIALKDSADSDFKEIWDFARNALNNSRELIWDLDWQQNSDGTFNFYKGGKCKESGSIPDSFWRHIQGSGYERDFDLRNMIDAALAGDKEAWKILENATFDICEKVSGMVPLAVVAIDPDTRKVIVMSDNGDAYELSLYQYFRNVPFAGILLEGYIRTATAGSISFYTLRTGSKEASLLTDIFNTTHKQFFTDR